MDYLCQYDWPGNVRELRNLIERSLILGSLNVSALYPGGAKPAPSGPQATTSVNVALASRWPLEVHSVPTCVPMLSTPL